MEPPRFFIVRTMEIPGAPRLQHRLGGAAGWNGFKHISGLIPEDEEKQSLHTVDFQEILLTHQLREVGSLSHYLKGFCHSCHGNSDCDASLWNTSI